MGRRGGGALGSGPCAALAGGRPLRSPAPTPCRETEGLDQMIAKAAGSSSCASAASLFSRTRRAGGQPRGAGRQVVGALPAAGLSTRPQPPALRGCG